MWNHNSTNLSPIPYFVWSSPSSFGLKTHWFLGEDLFLVFSYFWTKDPLILRRRPFFFGLYLFLVRKRVPPRNSARVPPFLATPLHASPPLTLGTRSYLGGEGIVPWTPFWVTSEVWLAQNSTQNCGMALPLEFGQKTGLNLSQDLFFVLHLRQFGIKIALLWFLSPFPNSWLRIWLPPFRKSCVHYCLGIGDFHYILTPFYTGYFTNAFYTGTAKMLPYLTPKPKVMGAQNLACELALTKLVLGKTCFDLMTPL